MSAGKISSFTEGYIELDGIYSKVECIGKGLDEDPKDLILLFPGNPGGVDFYTDFCKTLYKYLLEECKKDFSIWILGYAGIDPHPIKGIPSLKGREYEYGLAGQISRKKQFIEKFVPRNCSLYLMGHSIGSRIGLEVFKHLQFESRKDCKVVSFYGLFPVIERIEKTPGGQSHSPWFSERRPLALWIVYLLSFLPLFIRLWIASFIATGDRMIQAFIRLIDHRVVEKIFYLGETELQTVKELSSEDLDFIRENSLRIRLYYGTSDKWCPLKFCYELKAKVRNLKSYVCQKGMPHAFTFGRGDDMAGIVGDWIKEDDSIENTNN